MERISFDLLADFRDPDRLIEWCTNLGLITSFYICPDCGEKMRKVKNNKIADKYMWRCTKGAHNIKRSLRLGSWFGESKLSMREILMISYMWLLQMSNKSIMFDRGVSTSTVVEWKLFCREICIDACVAENEMIGGEGSVVELDENNFGKRKYNRGKHVDGKWVIAGVERGTSKCFMVVALDRTKETLLNAIMENVRPGSVIVSDCWKSYDCLEDEEFVQLAINRKYNFHVPATGDHTHSVDGMWGAIKRQLSPNHGRKQFDGYLFEYLWRRRHQDDPDPMRPFFQAVINVYTPKTHD